MSIGVSLMVQGMIGGELIRRTSDDNSSSLDHSLHIMAVRFSTFSQRKAVPIGSVEATGTGGFLLQREFEVFPRSSKRLSSNLKGSSIGRISSFSKTRGSGEGSGPNLRVCIVNNRVQLLECPHDLTYAVLERV